MPPDDPYEQLAREAILDPEPDDETRARTRARNGADCDDCSHCQVRMSAYLSNG